MNWFSSEFNDEQKNFIRTEIRNAVRELRDEVMDEIDEQDDQVDVIKNEIDEIRDEMIDEIKDEIEKAFDADNIISIVLKYSLKNDIDNKWKVVSTQNSNGQDCLVVEYDGRTVVEFDSYGKLTFGQ